MAENPFSLFDAWFADAQASEPGLPEAVALATATAAGAPSVRMVLLKGHGPDGFVFYTNNQSRKADELAVNPRAAMLFYWKSLRRQVRIEGAVNEVPTSQSDDYFHSRDHDSQVGAWASDQSRPLANRASFEARFAEAQARYGEGEVPRPPYWVGYRLVPELLEFWEERPFRLHHRRLFTLEGEGWSEGLLYP